MSFVTIDDHCKSCGELRCCPNCDIKEPERKPPTKRQLWRRVARLAGEYLFEGRNYTTWRSIDRGTSIVWMLREFIKETKSSTAYFKRKWQRRIAKMEAALKAWEECPE